MLQNTPGAGLHFNEASVTPTRISSGTCKFHLSVTAHNKHGQLTGFWIYSTDLFEHVTFERLAEDAGSEPCSWSYQAVQLLIPIEIS